MTSSKTRKSSKPSGVSFLILQSREIGAAEFKARCLEVMDEVQRTGIEIVITKHRKAVARLVPARSNSTGFCGALAGQVIEHGDLISPIDEHWDAE